MTLIKTNRIAVAHEEMTTEELDENLEEIADELDFELQEFENLDELVHEFGIYGALEVMAEESDKEIVLESITDSSFREDVWSGHVIGGKVMEVKK